MYICRWEPCHHHTHAVIQRLHSSVLHFLCIPCINSECAHSSNEECHKEALEERERLKLELESIRTTADTVEQELVHLEERMSALGEREAPQEGVVGGLLVWQVISQAM